MTLTMTDVNNQRAHRDLVQARELLDKLESVSASMARRVVPRLRRQIDQLSYDLARPAIDDAAVAFSAAKLAQEAMTAYAGALVRREGLDGGLCELADRLLDEIADTGADWAGLPTILGNDESIAPLSNVIHLRYPTDSVWSLPLVAHELGHHVASALTREASNGLIQRTIHPVEVLLEDEREQAHGSDGVSAWSHLLELFADVFATWAVGPAYACSLLMLRLDIARADEASFQHPSPNARKTAVLQTLRRLDSASDSYLEPNTTMAEYLDEWWAAHAGTTSILPGLSGLLPTIPPASLKHGTVERRLDDILSIVERDLAGARFVTTTAVSQMQAALPLRNEQSQLPKGVRLLDVISAAWQVRARKPQGLSEATLTRRTEALCRQIIARDETDVVMGN